jgi:hypothetical protein
MLARGCVRRSPMAKRISRRTLAQYCRYGLLHRCAVTYTDGRGSQRQAKITSYSGDLDDPLLHLVDEETGEQLTRWATETLVDQRIDPHAAGS